MSAIPGALAVMSRVWRININTNRTRASAEHGFYAGRLQAFYTWLNTRDANGHRNAEQLFYRMPGRISGRTTAFERNPANQLALRIPGQELVCRVEGGREYGPTNRRLHTHMVIKIMSFYMPAPNESSIRFNYDRFIQLLDHFFNRNGAKPLAHKVSSDPGIGDEYHKKDQDPFEADTDAEDDEEEDEIDQLRRFKTLALHGGHSVDQPDALERLQRNFVPIRRPFEQGRELRLRRVGDQPDVPPRRLPAAYWSSSSSSSASAARPAAPAVRPFASAALPKLSPPKPAAPDGSTLSASGVRIKPAARKPWPKRG